MQNFERLKFNFYTDGTFLSLQNRNLNLLEGIILERFDRKGKTAVLKWNSDLSNCFSRLDRN
jgi:hypothetical protein